MTETRFLLFRRCLLVLSALAPASIASAQASDEVEMVEYVVQEGDTCAAIARRAFGDRRRYDIIHEHNPDMGPPPHRLEAGTVLRLPRTATARGSGPDARVTAVVRQVEARAAEEPAWRRAAVGLGLYEGWRVTTQERSEAELTFRDTSIVHLRSDTLVIVYGPSAERTRRTGTTAQLDRGTLRTRLGELSGGLRLRVAMPASEAELRGGSAVIGLDDTGGSRLSNHDGAAATLRAAGGQVAVPPGMGSLARRGRRPERPRPLPAAPAWAQGPSRFLGVVGRGGTLRGAWTPVAIARRYRVEVASHADGRGVVAAVEVPAEVTRFEMHGLPAGRYFVRLSSIDGDGLESVPSEARPLEIVLASVLAPGERADASAGTASDALALDPSEEPRPLRVLPGARVELPEGVRCTLDGEPSSPLVLATPGATLACEGEEGEVEPFAVEVVQLALAAEDGTLLERVDASVEEPVSFTVRAPMSLPEALEAVSSSEGLEVLEAAREGDTLRVRAIAHLPGAHRVVLRAGETTLAAFDVSAAPAADEPDREVAARPEESEPEEAPEDEPPPGPWALASALGAVPLPSVVALEDRDHDGSGVVLAGSVRGALEGDFTRGRARIGARAVLLDARLGLGLDFLPGFSQPTERAPDRGGNDLRGVVSYRILPREPVSITAELGALFPTESGARGHLSWVRIVPTLHVSWEALDILVVRTRQSGIFDLSDQGGRLWASAYGVDLRAFGPLSFGIELDLSFGVETGLDVTAAALGGGLALDFAPVVLEVGARAGLGSPSDAVFGPYEVAVALRLLRP